MLILYNAIKLHNQSLVRETRTLPTEIERNQVLEIKIPSYSGTSIKEKAIYTANVPVLFTKIVFGPYYKSKLELKSNSSEILTVTYNFIYVHIFFFALKVRLKDLTFELSV